VKRSFASFITDFLPHGHVSHHILQTHETSFTIFEVVFKFRIEFLRLVTVHNLLRRTQCLFMQNILICFMNCGGTFPSENNYIVT